MIEPHTWVDRSTGPRPPASCRACRMAELAALRRELATTRAESREIDGRLAALLEASVEAPTTPTTASTAGKDAAPTLEALLAPERRARWGESASAMEEQIQESRFVAERVSRTVRQLDGVS